MNNFHFKPSVLGYTLKELAEKLLICFQNEDFPFGDITTELILDSQLQNKNVHGVLFSKQQEHFIISGLELAEIIYNKYDIIFSNFKKDGDTVYHKEKIFEIHGRYKDILILERSILNLIGFMSAISSYTNKFVNIVKQFTQENNFKGEIYIYDTRKTLPCLREISKLAVQHGGGKNHRLSLSDAILIKENHIFYYGIKEIKQKIQKIKEQNLAPNIKFIELEVSSIDMLQKVLEHKIPVDIIMLDNFTPSQIKQAVEIITNYKLKNNSSNFYKIEVSGGVRLHNLENYLIEGVDRIAIGSLTNHIIVPDMSFLIVD